MVSVTVRDEQYRVDDLRRQHPGLPESDARQWVAIHQEVDHTDASHWVSLGFHTPDMRPPGLDPWDVEILRAAGITNLAPGWADACDVCPDFLAEGAAMHKDPASVVALFFAMPPDTRDRYEGMPHRHRGFLMDCQYGTGEVANAMRIARLLREVDWADAAVCIEAGMSPEETRDFLLGGGDVEAARVMKALRKDADANA